MTSPRSNFSDLRDLHKCANDLLHSVQIQQALDFHHQHDQTMSLVGETSDASLNMLDLCGATRDTLLLVKDHFHDHQQIFRRVKIEGSNFEATQISAHGLNRKKLKKGISKCMKDIKGLMKSKYFTSDLSLIDHSLIVVVHVLREVRAATLSILESLTSLIDLPATITVIHGQRLMFASKLMCRGMLLERCDSMKAQMANERLEEVENAIEDLEVELECIIRRLMQTRVLLLNILTN